MRARRAGPGFFRRSANLPPVAEAGTAPGQTNNGRPDRSDATPCRTAQRPAPEGRRTGADATVPDVPARLDRVCTDVCGTGDSRRYSVPERIGRTCTKAPPLSPPSVCRPDAHGKSVCRERRSAPDKDRTDAAQKSPHPAADIGREAPPLPDSTRYSPFPPRIFVPLQARPLSSGQAETAILFFRDFLPVHAPCRKKAFLLINKGYSYGHDRNSEDTGRARRT